MMDSPDNQQQNDSVNRPGAGVFKAGPGNLPDDLHYLFLLTAAGAAANYFLHFDLFIGLQYLPGTIVAIIAARLFGALWGGAASILIHLAAAHFLGHPLFIVPLVGEAAFIGMMSSFGRTRNIVFYDAVYWPFIGAPLLFVLHNMLAPTAYEGVFVSTLTSWLCGISSSFVASILITYGPLLSRRRREENAFSVSVRSLMFDLFVGMVLVPVNIILSLNDRDIEGAQRREVMSQIEESGRNVYYEMRLQLEKRMLDLFELSDAVGAPKARAMEKIEFIRKANADFSSIHIDDAAGEQVATSHEGNSLALREQRAWMKTNADEMVSDLLKLPFPSVPSVVVGVPFTKDGSFAGAAFGVLDPEFLREVLVSTKHKSFHRVLMLDSGGRIIASTAPDRQVGSLYTTSEHSSALPTEKRNIKLLTSDSSNKDWPLWMKEGSAEYNYRASLENQSKWSLVIESPFAPYQHKLFVEHRKSLVSMLLINLFSIGLGLFASSRISKTLGMISRMSSDLPEKLLKEKLPTWPRSTVVEINSLIHNFSIMSAALFARFQEIEYSNETLELHIAERTRELAMKNVELQQEVTERKRTEQQRDHLMDELVNHLRFLQTLIDAIPNPIYYKDEYGYYLGCNIAFERDMGFSREEILGKSALDLFPPQMATTFINADNELLDKRGVQIFESEIMYADGGLRTILFCKAVFEKPDGSLGGLVGSIIDITERKKAEMDRDRLMIELKVKNKELEEVIYVASHDLRSPLVNVQGFSRKLAKVSGELEGLVAAIEMPDEDRKAIAAILGESIPKSLRFITSSVEKMDSLLSGLLRLSRLGRAAMCIDTVDMGDMIQKIISAMKFQLDSVNAEIEVGKLSMCQGDPVQINQLFTNLVDNAVKYRSPERPLRIRIFSENFDKAARFCVEDNGLGIPKEQQEKVWDIFHRLNPSDTPGEGLGLTIVKRIVSRHGGSVWVESEPGEGSSFYVILPKPGHMLIDGA